MIISASYKTDIPAFYGEWFLNRLDAGYCRVVHPYNRHQILHVPLGREEVDGFVFWTKNAAPFMKGFREVRERGHPFVVQYTINGYPRSLESRVVDAEQSIETFREINSEFGRRAAVWRYDTIVVTSDTPLDFHVSNFERLASALKGSTDEVVVSFAQFYKKTLRNMDDAAERSGFDWSDPSREDKLSLLSRMLRIAASRGMALTICSQPELASEIGREAHCVDTARLSDVAGRMLAAAKKGARKECGCFQSRDIGDYDTCPHGCVYCYAVNSRERALSRYRAHDPRAETLFPVTAPGPELRAASTERSEAAAVQLNLLQPKGGSSK